MSRGLQSNYAIQMSSKVLIYAAIIGCAIAQSVTSLFLPGIMSQALVGSVIDSVCAIQKWIARITSKLTRKYLQSASITTYSITCPSSTDTDECDIDEAMTAIEGPHTAAFNLIDTDHEYGILVIPPAMYRLLTVGFMLSISALVSCNLVNAATATCTTAIRGSGAGHNTGISTHTFTDASLMLIPVTITAAPSVGTSVSIPTAIRTATTIPAITSLALPQSPISTTGYAYGTNAKDHLAIGGFLAAMLIVVFYR